MRAFRSRIVPCISGGLERIGLIEPIAESCEVLAMPVASVAACRMTRTGKAKRVLFHSDFKFLSLIQSVESRFVKEPRAEVDKPPPGVMCGIRRISPTLLCVVFHSRLYSRGEVGPGSTKKGSRKAAPCRVCGFCIPPIAWTGFGFDRFSVKLWRELRRLFLPQDPLERDRVHLELRRREVLHLHFDPAPFVVAEAAQQARSPRPGRERSKDGPCSPERRPSLGSPKTSTRGKSNDHPGSPLAFGG